MTTVFSKMLSIILTLIHLLFPLTAFNPSVEPVEIEQPYPYVFVHGIFGWGFDDGISASIPYWGVASGKLIPYLNSRGYECYAASCGAISSTWDRTCELYAQLTGTTVDYGEAHSKTHKHNRYGRTYSKPLFENWSSEKKVNLLGHSFGGATIRFLAQLMACGNVDEQCATSEGISPLFTGGKSDWIYSVTTLASPHNGSSLTCSTDVSPNSKVLSTISTVAGIIGNSPLKYVYDFQLEQWGISSEPCTLSHMLNALKNVPDFIGGTDNAASELTIPGSSALNENISVQKNIYYFSYAGCCTVEDPETGFQVSVRDDPSLKNAAFIGSYIGEDGGYIIDEKWWRNDSMVNTISAIAPFNDPQEDFDLNNITPGIWMKMPVLEGWSHSSFINGPNIENQADGLADFYITQFNNISSTYS